VPDVRSGGGSWISRMTEKYTEMPLAFAVSYWAIQVPKANGY